jgi:hypothetical protein
MFLRECQELSVASAVVAALIVGCTDQGEPPPRTPVEPREVPWEKQIEAVRAGEAESVRMSLSAVTENQWAMLTQQCQSLAVLEADVSLLEPNALEELKALPHLRQLVLHGRVDDAWIHQIAALSGIRHLNLPDAQFTNAGLRTLAALPRLELLRFRSTHVNDEGMRTVATFPALRFLHLIDVPITDEGLAHLHGMADLESFYLDGGRCTDAGLQDLLQALPQLHFHRDQLHLPDDPHAHPHEEQEIRQE